ncbi:MAG: tetratricopeptide repeat protein [Rhodospirillales bacterium]
MPMTDSSEYENYLDLLQEIIDLQQADNITEALNLISANLAKHADKPELYLLTAVCSYRQNDVGQAIELCEKAHKIDPDNQEIVDSLAVLKTIIGQVNDGLYYAKLATTLMPHPDIPDLLPLEFSNFFHALSIAAPSRHFLDGLYLFNGRQFPDAVKEFEAELRINPDNAGALKKLGHAQLFVGKPGQALVNLSQYAKSAPDDAEVPALSAMAHCMLADFDSAAACCRNALEAAPQSVEILMHVLEAARYFDGELATFYDDVARTLNAVVADAATDCVPERNQASRNPDAPINIGMISNDLREGDQYAFLMALVENINPKKFKLTVYQQSPTGGPVFQEFKSKAANWRRIVDMDDDVLAMIIARQDTELLIDLCGFSSNSRAVVFAAKAAPVVTNLYCEPFGFQAPGTNVIISDAATLAADQQNIGDGQRIVVTEGGLFALRPLTLLGAVQPLPALENGHITFGVNCKPQHFSPGTVAYWSRVLQAVDGARLLMGNVANIPDDTAARIRSLFAASGVADRIDFLEATGIQDADKAFFNSIDIYLDSTPVNSTQTIAHALWMGVPAVSCTSGRRSGMIGASMLTSAGKPEWIGRDIDDAVRIATDLASDNDALARVRTSLREEIKSSALMDTRDHAIKMMAALEQAVA